MIEAEAPLLRSTGMKFTTVALALTLTLSVAPSALIAQTTATPTATPTQNPMNIDQRKENQQDRIAQGIKSGQLTPGETARIEHQEAGLNKEEHGMRAQDNGKLTAQDRKTLHQQQNQESRRIYRAKHNARKG
jgi:hypothetical protein